MSTEPEVRPDERHRSHRARRSVVVVAAFAAGAVLGGGIVWAATQDRPAEDPWSVGTSLALAVVNRDTRQLSGLAENTDAPWVAEATTWATSGHPSAGVGQLRTFGEGTMLAVTITRPMDAGADRTFLLEPRDRWWGQQYVVIGTTPR